MAFSDESHEPGLQRYPPFKTAKEKLPGLPRKQALLAQALLDEPEVIAFGSIREVAAQLDINAATVLRFAQVLGYSGYQSLQAAVRQAYLRYAGLQPPTELRLLAHEGSVLGHLWMQQRLDLDRLYERLEIGEMQDLCERIELARRVIVCGEGTSFALADVLVKLLQDVGIPAELLPASRADSALATLDLGRRDTVVAISLGLGFGSVAAALRTARNAQAWTLAITDPPGSPTAPGADRTIVVPSQGLGLSTSVLPTAALFETLAAMLAERHPGRVAELRQALLNRYNEEGLLAHGRKGREPQV